MRKHSTLVAGPCESRTWPQAFWHQILSPTLHSSAGEKMCSVPGDRELCAVPIQLCIYNCGIRVRSFQEFQPNTAKGLGRRGQETANRYQKYQDIHGSWLSAQLSYQGSREAGQETETAAHSEHWGRASPGQELCISSLLLLQPVATNLVSEQWKYIILHFWRSEVLQTLSRLKSRQQQGPVPFGGSRGEAISLSFPASRGRPHSSASFSTRLGPSYAAIALVLSSNSFFHF